jgi:uncharacterized protein
MFYIVDGHNLIPKIPGLKISDLDDEAQLIALLQEFCRVKRHQMEVYFDKAAPGQQGCKRFGMVSACFVRANSTADEAIRTRLKALGKRARNCSVVSSDRSVQTAAREYRASVVRAEDFAVILASAKRGQISDGGDSNKQAQEETVSQEEINYWLERFEGKKKK